MPITTKQKLLTGAWTASVDALETAVGRFRPEGLPNPCQVTFFEVTGDTHLHVNVVHRDQTVTASGWSGPGDMRDGFVHNRLFSDRHRTQIITRVREMVFAERD